MGYLEGRGRDFSMEMAELLLRFGTFLANELPVSIDLDSMIAERGRDGGAEIRLVRDLYGLVRDQPIRGDIAGTVEAFIAAWSTASMVLADLRRAPSPEAREVFYESFSWLVAEMNVMLDYIEKWEEDTAWD